MKARLERSLGMGLRAGRTAQILMDSAVSGHRARNVRLADDQVVVIGPWLSEIGFELLYWIPWLNSLKKVLELPADRIVAISRGGADAWYGDICGRYIDIFDFMSAEELKQRQEQRIAASGGQKHMGLSELDEYILREAREQHGIGDPILLHPSLMYKHFRPAWLRRQSVSAVFRHSGYRALRKRDPVEEQIKGLPERYVAVKAYFSSCLPEDDANITMMRTLIERLAANTDVVLLSTGLDIDDHRELGGAENVYDASSIMTPRNNLAVQTCIIRRADAFVGTYGGFSYLAPFLGRPSLSFFSEENFNSVHLDVMRRAVQRLRRQYPDGQPEFTAMRTTDLPLIDLLALRPDAGPTTSNH